MSKRSQTSRFRLRLFFKSALLYSASFETFCSLLPSVNSSLLDLELMRSVLLSYELECEVIPLALKLLWRIDSLVSWVWYGFSVSLCSSESFCLATCRPLMLNYCTYTAVPRSLVLLSAWEEADVAGMAVDPCLEAPFLTGFRSSAIFWDEVEAPPFRTVEFYLEVFTALF
jgi:hypothetical protein